MFFGWKRDKKRERGSAPDSFQFLVGNTGTNQPKHSFPWYSSYFMLIPCILRFHFFERVKEWNVLIFRRDGWKIPFSWDRWQSSRCCCCGGGSGSGGGSSELSEIWDGWVIDTISFFLLAVRNWGRLVRGFITSRGYCEFGEGFYEVVCARVGFLTFATAVE